jgi:dihydroxyacetone kinase-like predicted kinase
MVKYLHGEILEDQAPVRTEPAGSKLNLDVFNENSAFIDGYCTEFILQLMNGESYEQDFRLKAFINTLDRLGDSLVCVQDGKRVKVHIHTKSPAFVIEQAQRYGEFLTFKLENMQVQHNERDRIVNPKPHKPLSIVAVVNGAGMKTLFENLGADRVIDGEATMNTSAQEFVSAFESLNADEIVVLPNNKNVILAAEQAASLGSGKKVTVLPSKSFVEGYYAIAMDLPTEPDLHKRIESMRSGIDNVITLSETTASRDYAYHEIRCKKGEEIAFLGGELVSVNNDFKDAILGALSMIDDIDDRETGIVLRGMGVSEDDEAALSEAVSERYPTLELEFVDAGQEIYHWVIGMM